MHAVGVKLAQIVQQGNPLLQETEQNYIVKVHSGYPLQLVAMDILGPLPESNNKNSYVLVVSGYFTRHIEAYALPNQEAKTVAHKLVN